MNVDGGFQLSDVAGMARRRGKVAVLITLAVSLVAYWVAMALPNEFTSYATVLVEPQSVDDKLVRAGVQSSDLNERLHLMTAQILSRPRLSRIIEQFELYRDESEYLLRENIIDLMRERIRVAPVIPDLERGRGAGRRDLEINEFRIFFTDYDANLASQVAQRLANDFIETHINARVQVSQKSLEFIQGELERLAERIRAVEADVAKVKGEHPGKLPEDMLANQRRLERVLSDVAVAQRALAEATSDESFYRSQVAQAKAFAVPNDDASPVRRLELLRLQLAELKSRGFTDKHPDVISTNAEVANVEKAVAELDDGGGGPPNVLAQQTEAQARRATLRRESAEKEIFRLQGLADEIQEAIGKTPAVAEQLDGLSREYEHLFVSFQDFSNRHLEATVQAQLERRQLGEQFRVLEAAFPAPAPSAPNRGGIIMLGVMFGLALGGGLAVLLETADTSPHTARKLQNQIQLPVLASIPQIWLEADRIALRRRRLRSLAATAAVVVFGLAGGAMNYMWVNGAPGFLQGGDEEVPLDAGGTPVETAETGS
jgi:polysaccharide chain length determinant protein (PEP-CTERM system associated)